MIHFHIPTSSFIHSLRFYLRAPFPISRYRSGEVDKEFTTADGSYVFPNITQDNMTYASGDGGVKYYCTATNSFGTIRSPNVTAFYACE